MRPERRFLLDEIDGIINTTPPRATIRHTDNAENAAWFGRVSAAIEKWNPAKSSLAREYNDLFFQQWIRKGNDSRPDEVASVTESG